MAMVQPIGLVGEKCGMTHCYNPDNHFFMPITVVKVRPNRVVQIKTLEKDGYSAVQVTTGTVKQSKLNKAEKGHFSKAQVEPGRHLYEFCVQDPEQLVNILPGSLLTLEQFSQVKYVDVSGTTKGKGFAGTIKRHHFKSQDASHGNSLSHRVPGSIGQRQSPGKVFKNKRMPGHMGNVRRTILSLEVVRIDLNRQLILIKGSIPGAENGYILIRSAIKKRETA